MGIGLFINPILVNTDPFFTSVNDAEPKYFYKTLISTGF